MHRTPSSAATARGRWRSPKRACRPARPAKSPEFNDALTASAREAERKVRLVEQRYFAGLSLEKAARVLEISAAHADRHWAFARAWLHAWLQGDARVRRGASERRSPGA
ncbi:MAG: hypothetical protein JNN27_16720 [Planctomycetes bacterium]|nr:hypothetical protein [Planctomycetota bacterium]